MISGLKLRSELSPSDRKKFIKDDLGVSAKVNEVQITIKGGKIDMIGAEIDNWEEKKYHHKRGE